MPKQNDETPNVNYGVRVDSPQPSAPSITRGGLAQPAQGAHFAAPAPPGSTPSPLVYKSFLNLQSSQQAALPSEKKIFSDHGREKRAVWIVHGMGQQIPFETLDSLTEGIMSVALAPLGPDGKRTFSPKASSIQVGDQILQRVELTVRDPQDKRDIELHLYEAYWAPLTEGVSKLSDCVGFLVNGAVRGILNSVKPFKRAIFGDVCEFKVQKRVPFYISIVLILLASLAAINTVILAASGNKLKLFNFQFDPSMKGWLAVTSQASLVSALAISLGAILFLAGMCKPGAPTPSMPQNAGNFTRKFLSWISWLGAAFTSLGIVATAAVFALAAIFPYMRAWLADRPAPQLQFLSTTTIIIAAALIALAMLGRGSKRSEPKTSVGQKNLSRPVALFLLAIALLLQIAAIVFMAVSFFDPRLPWMEHLIFAKGVGHFLSSPWWVWPFLIFVSSQVRTMMVEYVGDVAIYVTSNKIDRFNDVRQKIKAVAYKSASAVFHAMTDDTHFAYEKIAVIGHSLGSEIAYDTLDQLINEDRMAQGKLRVAERTCLFETFGSPLNKIAFFFTIQGSDNFQIREQLAESVQPLIMDYKFRPFTWVNVRSLNDIISGAVYFYEWPKQNSSIAAPPPHPVAGTLTISPAGIAVGTGTLRGYKPVDDKIDPHASVALAAHTEYWKNPLIWQELYRHITA